MLSSAAVPKPDPSPADRADPTTPAASSRRAIFVRLWVSVLLAVAFAAAVWPRLQTIPANVSIPWWVVPAYVACLVPYHLARAGRWHLLLRPLGTVRAGDSLRVSMAGYMWIALLPFRLGEFSRPLLLRQCSDITVQRALGTVAIERVIDGLTICGVFFATSAGISASELGALSTAATGVMAAFATALLGLLLLARFPTAMGRLIDATAGRIVPRAAAWASKLSQGIAEGLAALPRGGPLLAFVGVTAVYWAANAAGMWLLAHGCGLPITLPQAALVMAVMNIALLVPGGPAQLGIFQAGVAVGLHLVVSPQAIADQGSTFAFYLYMCQLGTIVVAGLWAQRSLRLDWRAVIGAKPSEASADDPPEPETP